MCCVYFSISAGSVDHCCHCYCCHCCAHDYYMYTATMVMRPCNPKQRLLRVVQHEAVWSRRVCAYRLGLAPAKYLKGTLQWDPKNIVGI